jgi:PAS domain S-box-containing protein
VPEATLEARILVLSPIGKDAQLLANVLAQAGMQAQIVADMLALCEEGSRGAGALLLAEETLRGHPAQALRMLIEAQPPWSDLPLLILTASGADSPTAQYAMERLGNVTLLERPLQRATLVSAARSALRASARQHQIRMYLEERERSNHVLRQQSQKLAEELAERHRVEASLRRSQQLYRSIGESIDYGVWLSDAQGNMTYASESLLELIGAPLAEYAGNGWFAFMHPDERAATGEAWRTCVAAGRHWDREVRFRGVDGLYHPVLSRGVTLRDDEGRIIGWAGINLDISRQRAAQETLREADRRKDEFLATLAHELRNPLAPIGNAVAVMALKTTDPSVKWARDIIDRQVSQLRRLVDDLLDVSRITQGKVALRLEPVVLADVVRAAVDTSRPLIDAARHQLVVELPQAPVRFVGDAVRLSQCLSNLLNNAAKYTPPGGVIELRVEAASGELTIRVRDNGIGIAPDALGSIFEMFGQADRGLDRSQGGLGIGLTLVRSFIGMHGGTVDARSDGPGRGSEFCVRLPLRLPGHASPDGTLPFPVRERAAPCTVLVVDDNVDGSESLAALLRIVGYDVCVAHDGERAMPLAAELRPAVVLLDIGMPKMDGHEAARRIRAQPWGREILLIAVTGWGQESDRQRSRDAGFDHHMTKPVDTERLLQLMATASPARAVRA